MVFRALINYLHKELSHFELADACVTLKESERASSWHLAERKYQNKGAKRLKTNILGTKNWDNQENVTKRTRSLGVFMEHTGNLEFS